MSGAREHPIGFRAQIAPTIWAFALSGLARRGYPSRAESPASASVDVHVNRVKPSGGSQGLAMDRFIALIGILMFVSPASGQTTTVCDGSGCVMVSGGTARKMSEAETARHYREQSLQRLEDVDCAYARNPQECTKAKQTLRSLFYN